MMRSMFAGVVGLRSHQFRMDVIGNNVANINTTAFRGSRVTFQDIFSQTLRGASGPTGTFGGTNPQQIGLGVGLATVDINNTPGSMQLTGRDTDMAIEGNGFFIMRTGGQLFYTRAGAFDRDAQGYLVNPANGMKVQGWMARTDGTFDIKDQSTITDIRVPVGDIILPEKTENVYFNNSLNANAPEEHEHTTAVSVFDSLGRMHTVLFKFMKHSDKEWDVAVMDPTAKNTYATVEQDDGPTDPRYPKDPADPTTGSGPFAARIAFTDQGLPLYDPDNGEGYPLTFTFTFHPPGLDEPQTVTLDMTQLSQPAIAGTNDSTAGVYDRDGYPMGALEGFTIGASGVISGIYSNGLRKDIAQVALANFANPAGLLKAGYNTYVQSNNSGIAQVGEPGGGGRGRVAASNLEMSNVDMSAEFTNMIVTQRGFQANSRIISASDEMLQELANMKR